MKIEQELGLAIEKWHRLDTTMPKREKNKFFTQWYNYRRIKHAMKKCIAQNQPLSFQNLAKAKQTHQLAECFLQMPVPEDMYKDYVKVTEAFTLRAKERCPQLVDEDVFQALRNVWIMVFIQSLAGKTICLTDAMFGYSMLYPLTDNVTDDPTLTEAFKNHFIKRFGLRLQGELLEPENQYETDVFYMIECMESDFSRTEHPKVYESIMAIFHAQRKSMSQQYEALTLDAIQRITFEKGATSVLADGFLVLGDMDDTLFTFLIQYGIVLQLSDDLQDLVVDAKHHHKTLFNSTQDLDALMNKLFRFTDDVLSQVPNIHRERGELFTKLLEVSISALYSDAIFLHKSFFTKSFVKEVHESHVMGLSNHAKLKKYAMGCLGDVKLLESIAV